MIGVASPSFCFNGFSDMARKISEHFRMWEVLVELEHTIDVIEPEVDDVVNTYDLRVQVHAPMSDVNIGSVYERMRLSAVDDILRTAEFCRKHDISVLTVHPGFYQGIAFLDKPKVLSQTRRSLVEIGNAAAEHSVSIAVENMPKGINATCTTAAELLGVVEGTGLGICFDMGHANTAGEVDAMLSHIDRFANVHLHNNDGSWDQHCAIDQGTADVSKVVPAILGGGFKGNMIIESTDLEGALESKRVLRALLEDAPAPHTL
ncbi:TPA: sugar phosphate isomerase/epimerase [Thermoplasmata archaeon]|nr:sugar phosphate isomerase/epimerase [Thermoplasmata archaeon]